MSIPDQARRCLWKIPPFVARLFGDLPWSKRTAALSTRGVSPMYEAGCIRQLREPGDAHDQANAISRWLLAGCHNRYFASATLLLDQPKDRSASLQPVPAIAPGGQGRSGCSVRSLHTGDPERATSKRKEAVRDHQGRFSTRRRSSEVWGHLFGRGGEHALSGPALLGRSRGRVLRPVDFSGTAHEPRFGRRAHVHRQEQSKDL